MNRWPGNQRNLRSRSQVRGKDVRLFSLRKKEIRPPLPPCDAPSRERRKGSPAGRSLHLKRRRSQSATLNARSRTSASARQFSTDPETGVAPGMPGGRNMRSRCRCSMCPAIHINSRSWLRSSSTHEPSDPPLRVVLSYFYGPTGRGNSESVASPYRFERGKEVRSLSPVLPFM